MMRLLLFSLILLTAGACSSGKTAIRHGHFDLAVQRASHRLTQRPGLSKRGHPLALLVLRDAFTFAYQQHQAAIRRLSQSVAPRAGQAGPLRWEAVHAEYDALQTLTNQASRCTDCAGWLAAYPASYADRQQEVRQLAAADRYDLAEQAFALREENRLAAKDAYLNYQKTLDWVADYRQARAKMQDVLPWAVLRVVVEPLGPTSQISPGDNAELQGLIFGQLGRNDRPSPFVKLYPPDETAGDGFPIHEVVQMRVTSYGSYDDRTSSSCTTVTSAQQYKVGTKKINDSTTVDVMENVKGTLTTYRRDVSADLTLGMRGVDTQTGLERWTDSIWESRSWTTEWQTFSGDSRALNGSSLKTASLFVPSRWEFYREMRDELARDVPHRLHRRYARE